MLCLWRVMHHLAARCLHHLRFTCRVRSARDTETSRDHLLDRTIDFARIFCARSRFPYKLFSAREFCRGESFSSELCSSTSEFEQNSRLLSWCSRDDLSSKGRPTELQAVCCATVVRWPTRGDVTTSPATWTTGVRRPRGRTWERRRDPRRVPSLPWFAVVRGIETCLYRPAATVQRRRVPTCRCTCRYWRSSCWSCRWRACRRVHVAVVCCVSCVSLFLLVLTFGTSLFPRHPPSVLFGRYR